MSEYLRAWHRRTGRPEDELVSFDVYWVRDQCPKPGESQVDEPFFLCHRHAGEIFPPSLLQVFCGNLPKCLTRPKVGGRRQRL